MLIKEYKFPDFEEILKLEKISNKSGSGITYEDLVGLWRFQYVWKKGDTTRDNISSSLLQILYGSLELSKVSQNEINKNNTDLLPCYEIKNSINFGILSVTFIGKAYLKGIRPILLFYFSNLSIKLIKITVFYKSFKKPDLKNMPFFSFIAIEKNKKWMCARGKGGGIAIWVKSI